MNVGKGVKKWEDGVDKKEDRKVKEMKREKSGRKNRRTEVW